MIRVGVVGLGYWGPNLVRCFSGLDDCKLTAVCDQNIDMLTRITDRYPGVRPVERFESLFDQDLVDAVVLATPTSTHYALAKRALENGLHVFVEKPMAETSQQCRELMSIAEQRSLTLFVGHVFLHSSPVVYLKELVDSGELGHINYISSRRLNLGPVRQDVNALYDLAPHDISMMLYLLGVRPQTVACTGLAKLTPGIHDVCNLSMDFGDNRMGMAHVSWLDPRKERVLTIVGDKKMAVLDDLEQEKIKVYDKGVNSPARSTDFAEFQISYRYGGSYCPFIRETEPLKSECMDFIRCVKTGGKPLTDGANGLEVVEVLEAAQLSLSRGGAPIEVGCPVLVD